MSATAEIQAPQGSQPKQIEEMIAGLILGNEDSYRVFWDRYGNRLNGIARKYMPRGLERRMEPADLVQSVCKSFFRRASEGELQLTDADSLWGLLCAITLNKMRMNQRFHLAQKRSLSREQDVSWSEDCPQPFALARDPRPDAAVVFEDEFDQVMSKLDEQERQIVQLRMEGHTNSEAAQEIGCSERTVRRMLVRIRSKLINSIAE